ncbi:MAG: hypothetical protein WAU32_07350 [Thermoanaerobaculia bacterium]
MSSSPAGPRCPRCHRPLAAWRMDHCVYCGEAFPAELKQGFQEPEALKWVERPGLPPDVTRKLEMMKVVPLETRKPARNFVAIAGVVSIPIFGAIFYLTYTMLKQLSPTSSLLILVAGIGVVAYLVYIFAKARK